MRNIFIVISTTSTLLLTTPTQASELEFHIQGVRNDEGKIYVQLFKGEENYKQDSPAGETVIKAKAGANKVIFTNIEAGEYAVRFFHDENTSGTLDTNLLGMPIEGYGFSNDAKPDFGPVSFNNMKFMVSGDVESLVNQSTTIY
jgi:uncharacterized protein (DUF2141 family)